MSGLVDYFLFFLDIGSRRVIVTGMTAHPDVSWMSRRGIRNRPAEYRARREMIRNGEADHAVGVGVGWAWSQASGSSSARRSAGWVGRRVKTSRR